MSLADSRSDIDQADPAAVFSAMFDGDQTGARFGSRQAMLEEQARAFVAGLTAEGASALIDVPDARALELLVEHAPNRVAGWLDRILGGSQGLTTRQLHNLGLALASAYTPRDGEKARAAFEQLMRAEPVFRVRVGGEAINYAIWALFRARGTSVLDPLRERALLEPLDDAGIEMVVAAAERAGHVAWLEAIVERYASSGHAGLQARALMVAGLREVNEQSEAVLNRDWGTGFLGGARQVAAAAYERNQWSRHWFDQLAATDDPTQFWRFGILASRITDRRFHRWYDTVEERALMARFGEQLYGRMEDEARKRTRKREDTLFGLKRPSRELQGVLTT